MDYHSRQKIVVRIPASTSLGETMRRQKNGTTKINSQIPPLIPSWRHVAFCTFALAMVLAFSGLPVHAQLKTKAEVGVNVGANCTDSGPCYSNAPIMEVPPLMKPVVVDDEKCLPWNLSAAQSTNSTVKALKVPSKARGEYQKACEASQKKKPEEAEQHLRRSIDKFKDYSAAWVLLGVVLDEQNKEQEARDACSHAATINGKYFPAYLCLAEFSARNQEWARLLELANAALGINSENDGYAHYYRAMAYFYLNNLVEAQKDALQSAEVDLNHNYLPLYFLLAQIYAAQGDRAAAAAQLRVALKNHNDPAQEVAARRYLAKLEAAATTTISQKSVIASESAGTIPLTDQGDDETIAAMSELRTPNDSWIPEDIDRAVPPVASG
jgi:hypothetical protein